MTGSRHEPNSAATSATYATDPCLSKAVVDGEPKVGWPKRHDPQASAAAREHGLALNAAAIQLLPDKLVVMSRQSVADIVDDWLQVEP